MWLGTLKQRARTAVEGLFDQETAFGRLALVQVAMVAGDTLVTISLAKTVFFTDDPGAAKGKVLLYLLLTVAPFAVVSPLLGPLIDASRGARRLVVFTAAAGRVVLCVMMASSVHSLLLYPLAFCQLVLSKLYLVTRGALVPEMAALDQVKSHERGEGEEPRWVEPDAHPDVGEGYATFNAQLTLLGTLAGFVISLPGIALLQLTHAAPAVLVFAALAFTAAAACAMRLRMMPARVRGRVPSLSDEEAEQIDFKPIDEREVIYGLTASATVRLTAGSRPGQAGEGLGAAAPERGALRRALHGQRAEPAQPPVGDRDDAEVGAGHAVLEVGGERHRGPGVVHREGQPVEGRRGDRRRAARGDHAGQRVACLVVPGPVPHRRIPQAAGQVRAGHPVPPARRVLRRQRCLQRRHRAGRPQDRHRRRHPPRLPSADSAEACVAWQAAMLANNCASDGSTVASRCTREAADPCSAARSRAIETAAGARPGEFRFAPAAPAAPAPGADPGGTISLARSRVRCCSCWDSSAASSRAPAGLPPAAERYRPIRSRSAAITARSVVTPGAGRGGPASGSGPANRSCERQPAVPSSSGSAAAVPSSTRRLGSVSGTPARYHGCALRPARPLRAMAGLRIG